MPFNGNGTYYLPTPEYPATSGDTILASDFNTIVEDIQDALSNCVTKDGQTTLTATIPFGGYGISGLGGTAAAPAIRWNSADGFYSTGAGDVSISINGTRVGGWAAAGYIGTISGSLLTGCSFDGSQDFTAADLLVATQAAGNNSTKSASTAFVQEAIAATIPTGSISEAVNDSAYLYLANNYV